MSSGEQDRADEVEAIGRAIGDRIAAHLVDEVRHALHERHDDDPILARLESLEQLARAREQGPSESVDLGSVSSALADVLDAVASLGERIDALAAAPTVDVMAVQTALTEVVDAVSHQIDDGRAAAANTIAAIEVVADRVDQNRLELQPIAARLEATERTAAEIRGAIDAVVSREDPPVDLDPVVRSIEDLRVHYDETQPDLSALINAMKTLRSQIIDSIRETSAEQHVDITPLVAQFVDGRAAHRDELAEVQAAIARLEQAQRESRVDVQASIEHLKTAPLTDPVDLEPLLDAVTQLRGTVPTFDVERLEARIAELAEAMPTIDLAPVIAALDGIDRRLDDTSGRDRVAATIDQVADDLAGARSDMARSDMARSESLDQLSGRLDALQSAVDALRADESLREAELRLARRVDTNSEALRSRIDDQRVLADSLAANVSQLNAALTVASEEPQQLRRDLDRILEQLAERMGGAMRELRNELKGADEPLALRSSVEAGLDRITGRFQSDTGRILHAVASAQEDADGRLRRIDNQVTELRRAVDRVRRDTEPLEANSPT